MKVSGTSRAHDAKVEILNAITEGRYPGPKLPSEEDLANELGVSVITLREALRELHNDGYITKKHGSGNFIHRSALGMNMRMDKTKNLSDLLKGRYETIHFWHSDYRKLLPGKTVREMLQLSREDETILYERKILVDEGKVAVFSRNYIPVRLFQKSIPDLVQKPSIMDFIWENCRQEVVQTAVYVTPFLTDEVIAEHLGICPEEASIRWNEVFHNMHDVPLGVSIVYFHPRLVDMHLIIKW